MTQDRNETLKRDIESVKNVLNEHGADLHDFKKCIGILSTGGILPCGTNTNNYACRLYKDFIYSYNS